jgi:hypothetical protein
MRLSAENIGNFPFERASTRACCWRSPATRCPRGRQRVGSGVGPGSTVSPPRCPGPSSASGTGHNAVPSGPPQTGTPWPQHRCSGGKPHDSGSSKDPPRPPNGSRGAPRPTPPTPVAGLMNSCAAICGLEAPALARRAISASCAVRTSGVPRKRRDRADVTRDLDPALRQYLPAVEVPDQNGGPQVSAALPPGRWPRRGRRSAPA